MKDNAREVVLTVIVTSIIFGFLSMKAYTLTKKEQRNDMVTKMSLRYEEKLEVKQIQIDMLIGAKQECRSSLELVLGNIPTLEPRPLKVKNEE